MKTGEGKTLVATLPVYLNALAGRGVHVVAINDYLARRDADWMGQIYKFLGLTVGVIVHGLDDEQRKQAYDCDITYGTNNELGFDYLRDNMKYRLEGHGPARPHLRDRRRGRLDPDRRGAHAADHLRPARRPFRVHHQHDRHLHPQLDKADYEVDEKQRTVTLTEAGMEKMEQRLGAADLLKGESLYDVENVSTTCTTSTRRCARNLFQRDKDYIVRNGEVVIIDEFTGRMMPGRRYSDGLHQALEAKEHQNIQPENQTLASIRIPEPVSHVRARRHDRHGGDRGRRVHGHLRARGARIRPTCRSRASTRTTRSTAPPRKYRAVLAEIEQANLRFQPVLVGTASIEKSELLAEYFKKAGFKQIDFADPAALERLYAAARSGKPSKQFAVLNARFHEQEAFIIAEAGVPGAITIATNMASRSTDIKLGGNVDMRVAQETAAIADEAEEAEEVAEIKAEVERFREIVLQGRGDDRDRAGEGQQAGQDRHQAGRPLHRRHRAPRVRGASTTSCAAAPASRAIPAARNSYLSLGDDLMRIFRVEQARQHAARNSASRKTRRSSIRGSTRRWRRRSRRSKPATSISARTCSNTTT